MLHRLQTFSLLQPAAARTAQTSGHVQTAPSLLGFNIQLQPPLHADVYQPRFRGDNDAEERKVVMGPPAKKQKKEEHPELRGVTDPAERRKIQNKLAQRRFREKEKDQKEDLAREEENQKAAEREGERRAVLWTQHQEELTAKYHGLEYHPPVTSYAGGFIAFPSDQES